MLKDEPNLIWMACMPKWCFPEKLITLGLLMKHNSQLRYGDKYGLEDIENCTKFYHGKSLTGLYTKRCQIIPMVVCIYFLHIFSHI